MLRRIGLLFLLFLTFRAEAQLTADFTANVTSGCEPLVVNFTDLSTGGTITSREWIFGYGGNISNNNNPTPSAAYPAPGTYTVTLIISDGTQTASITKPNYITVHAKPTPSFSVSPSSGCAPLAVNFNNSSTAGSGTITAYQWDFDDGSSFSSSTNPNHTYISAGNFSPTLKVTNSFGCTKTAGQGTVNVSSGPTAAFTSGTNQACDPPLTVSFSNQSTGVGPMSYAWDLDITTSSAQSPSATYTQSGFYDIALTVTDAYGCSDTLLEDDYVAITDVEAEFELADSVCAGVYIGQTNTSVGASNFQWQWGDGTTSFGQNPQKSYTNGGTYTITLTATSGTCSDTYTKTVHVQKVTANFTTSVNYGCEFPHTTTYTDASTTNFGNVVSWLWRSEDVSTVTPSGFDGEVYYDSVIQNVRYQPGLYSDTLQVWTELGCTDVQIINDNVLLESLMALMSANPSAGCVPVQASFIDNSFPTPSYPIVNWWWDLGNGDTSIAQNPFANYTDTGCYDIIQVIENAFGCRDTAVYTVENGQALCYGDTQQAAAALSLTQDTACAGAQVIWHDSSFDQTYITDYFWHFDDDTIRFPGVYSDDTTVGYSFLDTGWINLEYIVGQHGCWDTTYYDSAIYIKGPAGAFEPILDCDTPMVRWIDGIVLDAQRFYWDFGDGSPVDSVNVLPSHTYTQSGNYQITMELYNDSNGCSFTRFDSVYVRNLVADFDIDNNGMVPADSAGCVATMFNFIQDCEDHEAVYNWYYDTIYQQNFTFSTQFNKYIDEPGFKEITLQVQDINGCMRSKTHSVFVSDPKANFGFTKDPGCDPVTVNFIDSSTSDTNIVSWQWFLGDASGYHYEQNPIHDYPQAGNYQIRLTVTDSVGCSDIRIKYLPVSFPFPGFYVDTTLCQFSPVNFTNTSNGVGLNYHWNFDNGITSTDENPSTLYVDTGTHYVQLAIVDSQGCRDTVVQAVHVQNRPEPVITADTLYSPCLPLTVTFTDSSTSDYLEIWKWTFGDGSASVELDTNVAFHTYTEPGLFDITLQLTTSYGCKRTITEEKYIEVRGPYADFDVSPDSVCLGEQIAFFITENQRTASYRWVFGDGEDTLVSGDVDTVYHTYNDTVVGWRTPVVVYYDTSNTCEIPVVDSIYVHKVSARFGFFPDSVACGQLNTRLINKSVGDDNMFWSFGEGRTSQQRSPNIYFPEAGTYEVELFVENRAIGCKDTMMIPFTVFPNPDVKAFGDTLICLYDSTLIRAEFDADSLEWSWSPLQGLASPDSTETWATPDTTRYYVVSAEDTNGCVGEDSVRVVVQDVPELDLLVDTTVVIGEEFKLNPSTPDSLIYQWAPPHAFDCPTCANPWFKAEESNWYAVLVQDIYGCFEKEFKFQVTVEEKYSVDMPDLFSPNGDGVNDEVFVRGWGIEELEEFSIFNRWGQEIFRTNDLKQGWDGTFNGAKQQMDTYAYVVKVKFYDDNEQVINGFIELIR